MRTVSTTRSVRGRAPKVGRPRGRFTQHRRIDQLRSLLERSPIGLTLEEIASTLKITQRSVRRYLRELDGTNPEQSFEVLEPVETRRGGPLLWRIKPGERGRAVSLRRAQAYALLSTRRALEIFRGSAFYEEADLALSQIAKVAQTPFRVQRGEISGERNLEDRFFFVPAPHRSYAARGEDLDELFRAVADLRVLRYRPRTRGGEPRTSERVAFLPYAMVVHRGALVLVGKPIPSPRDRDRDREVEVLPFDAMADIRASETEHFQLPGGFDVAAYIHGELGVAKPARARFIVEFDARVADDVKARRFHPQQRIGTAPDGRVRLSLPLVDTRAAIAFVLAWGDAAKIVDPPELELEVGEILVRAAARYA